MRVTLLPYTEIDGIRTMTDSEVMGLYSRLEDEGLVDIVFSDGEINDADGFLRAMKYGENMLFSILVGEKLAGIVWLNRFKGSSAYVHFSGFVEFLGEGSVEIGKRTMSQIINLSNDGKPLFEVLLGLIPCSNVIAIKWLKKVGLKKVGVIPKAIYNEHEGQSEDGMLFYLERDGGNNENL